MEDSVGARDGKTQAHEDNSSESHDCGDSPEPVGPMCGDVDVGGLRVKEHVRICV